jgi:hypothetical protein
VTPRAGLAAASAIVCLAAAACGKKGPPLPPLVKLPVAPADLTVSRRADAVQIQFVVPNTNTDNTRPANIARVDVYALTGQPAVSEREIVARGARIASLPVKTPRDPNATYDPDDPDQSEADVEPPEGKGLDQGVVALVRDTLGAEVSTSGTGDVRTYVGVGVTARGRQGAFSRRAAVPLGPPPSPPPPADVTYTETAITVRWPAPPGDGSSPPQTFQVYQTSLPGATSQETQLTKAPIAETEFVDSRMSWGDTRCYVVRRVETVGALKVESEPTPPACVTLRDRFPPMPPRGLQAVATAGVINLIWDANPEADLDGYILLRAMAPGDELIPVTTALIHETAYQDPVPAGVPFVYAVQAVDRSGNLSQVSARVEETAR